MPGELILLAANSGDDINGWGALVIIAMLGFGCFVCWLVFRD
jgi:hypothetical protein